MRSYISSSNRRYPVGSWFLTWLFGLVLAGSILCAMEFFFRAKGHRTSVTDDRLLWAYHRHRIYDVGKRKTVVLLGTSRIAVGFVPKVFEQHYPDYRIVQLAIIGGQPFAALRDLAYDKRFTGIVIFSMHPRALCREHRKDQQPYVDFYHKTYLSGCYIDEEFNRSVSTLLQKKFVISNPALRLDNIVRGWIRTRSLPAPGFIITHSNRSSSADFTKIRDIVAFRQGFIDGHRSFYEKMYRLTTPEEWLDQAMKTEPLVKAIQLRGGQVVFVRYITTDGHYEIDQKYYPKKQYWDNFAKMTSAIAVHFEDVPELSSFTCPDNSHLDFRDAPRFTIALGNELCQLGVIRQ